MKRLLAALAALVLLGAPARAQTPVSVRYQTTDPSLTVNCTPGQMVWNTTTFNPFLCNAPLTGGAPRFKDMLTNVPGGVSFPLLAPNGLNTAPSYSFSSDPDSGFYHGGLNNVILQSVNSSNNQSNSLSLSTATNGTSSAILSDGTELVGWNYGLGANKGFSYFATFTEGFASYVGAVVDNDIQLVASASDTGTNSSNHTIKGASHNITSTNGTGTTQAVITGGGEFNVTSENYGAGSIGLSANGNTNTIAAVVTDGTLSGEVTVLPTGVRDVTQGAKPTCDTNTRNHRWFVRGGLGVADTYEVCMKSAANTFAWVVIATNP